ncbi:MAG: extracellular substrate binding-like orphan protein GrrP [Synechococcaceae cyanobacterium]|nr:extracellular substrate binding-like orphan protein GrrP [Synechococcaceae cyanobacterium]
MLRHPVLRLITSRLLPTALLITSGWGPIAAARAEGVVQRVVRTGQLVIVTVPDAPPMMSTNSKGEAVGFAVELARILQADLKQTLAKPVKLRFLPVTASSDLYKSVALGKADFACGLPFRWDQDTSLDFTLPIGLSGLRLLAPAGRFDGSPAGLSGKRIGVVAGTLGQTQLQGMQPQAVAVPFPTTSDAVAALGAGKVDGVIGDSLLLASLGRRQGGDLVLTPEQAYQHYALTCAVPENDSAFRDQVNLAIARMMQAYIDGVAETVALVHSVVGPESAARVTPEAIRAYFENVLRSVEPIRPLSPSDAAAPR